MSNPQFAANFTRDTRTVLANGAQFTDRHRDIEARWDTFTAMPLVPAAERLATAIINNAPAEELQLLTDLAAAESLGHGGAIPSALARARKHITRALKDEAAESGRNAHRLFTEQFNTAAEQFTTLATIQNPATPGDRIVGLPKKAQDAWLHGRKLVDDLNRLEEALGAAARLAGVWVDPMHTGHRLGLVVTRGTAHRRRVWEAWTSPNRWTDLVNTGATLHAVDLDKYEPFREPRTVIYNQGNRIDVEDYEDTPHARDLFHAFDSNSNDPRNRWFAVTAVLGDTVDNTLDEDAAMDRNTMATPIHI